MRYYYKLLALLLCLGLLLLSGCTNSQKVVPTSPDALTIGVTPGPQAEIMAFVQEQAHQEGLELKLVEYQDYVQPNVDLHQGKLWGNSLQHEPYLRTTLLKEPKFKLVAAFKTISYPLALYPGQRPELLAAQVLQSSSQEQFQKPATTMKQESLAKLTIGVPNDPTSLSRSLQLLAAARYLKLKSPSQELYTLADIESLSQQTQLIPMDAALLPQMLPELDMAVISCNYALLYGLRPSQDAIFMENGNNPYVNVFVTNQANSQDPRLKQLARLYRSQATKEFILKHYQGAVLPSW